MKKGAGHGKGAAFERKVCKQLSLWVSDGQREDCFWRSALSGGRATVGRKAGKDLRHQAGDICAVHKDGHQLTDRFFIECKHYNKLDLGAVLFGKGRLAKFWRTAVFEAKAYDRAPMLICRENNGKTLVLVDTYYVGSTRLNAALDQSQVRGGFVPKFTVLFFDALLKHKFSEIVWDASA